MFTDCFWVLALVGLIAANVILIGPMMLTGSASDMMSFYDSTGNRCGMDAVVKDFPIT